MERTKELLFNTIIIGIGKFSTQIISFLLLPIYTSMLSTEEYGFYDLIVTITTLLLPFITLLMEESMFRFLIDCKDDNEKKKTITQAIVYSTVGIIIFSIIFLLISLNFQFAYKIQIYLYILLGVIVALRNALSRGLGKIKLFSLANFINSLIIIILNILFIVYFKIGIIGLLYSYIIASFITSCLVFIKLNISKYFSLNKIDLNLMKEMIKYSIPLVPNSISWTIINLSSRIIISTFIGTAANGIYSIANKFPTIIDSVYNFFYTSWKESAAKSLKDDDTNQFYNFIYKNLANFMWAITIGMIASLPFVFGLLVKNEFVDAYKYIPILLISIYFGNMSGFYGGIFSAYKNTKIMGVTTIISAVLNILINVIFIKSLGIWSAAIATFIANLYVYLFRKYKIKKYVKLEKSMKKFITVFMLGISVVSYYSKILILQIVILAIIIIYCILINKEILLTLLKTIFNKIKTRKVKV